MWSIRNKKSIKLSRQLNWSVGKKHNANKRFWIIGSLCLVAAVLLITHTNRKRAEATPQILGATTETVTTSSLAVQFEDYEVARGDTLFSISNTFGVPTETLAQLNDIRPPFVLKAGETLKIPTP